jgi:hypothetical protein
MNRREFLLATASAGATFAWPKAPDAQEPDLAAIVAEIGKRHDESLRRLQEWIRQPSIAAENRGMNEGCDLMMRMLRDAGFAQVRKVPTRGQPGVFATLDAGAPKTLAVYFMYDVKQVDPSEWSSPPWDAAILERPGLGKVLMGRGVGLLPCASATPLYDEDMQNRRRRRRRARDPAGRTDGHRFGSS